MLWDSSSRAQPVKDGPLAGMFASSRPLEIWVVWARELLPVTQPKSVMGPVRAGAATAQILTLCRGPARGILIAVGKSRTLIIVYQSAHYQAQ